MLVKFGSVITEGSGSLGGHTIQHSKGGMQLRTKPIPKKKPSAAQSLIRSYNPILQAGWRDLTDQQRARWNDFAHPTRAGHSLWMKYQFEYIQSGLSFQLDPYKAKTGPFGPELILNGTFDNSDHWILSANWTISGGKLNSLSTNVTSVYTPAIFVINNYYRVQFEVSNMTAGANLLLFSWHFQSLFAAPYHTYFFIHEGKWCLDLLCAYSASYFAFYSNRLGKPFSLDNITIKQIL